MEGRGGDREGGGSGVFILPKPRDNNEDAGRERGNEDDQADEVGSLSTLAHPLASSTPSSSSMSNPAPNIDGGLVVTSPGTPLDGSSSGTTMALPLMMRREEEEEAKPEIVPTPPLPLPGAAAVMAMSRGRQRRYSHRVSCQFPAFSSSFTS